MEQYTSCKLSIQNCIENKLFSIAHLYSEESTMSMHIHDCYEIYFSVTGGKQVLIDNKFYDINPGDLFVINQFESHHISKIDKMVHERIVISIYPELLKSISTPNTNLNYCFSHRPQNFSHKISLSSEQQSRFMYFINKIASSTGFGSDMIDYASFIELITSITKLYINNDDVEEYNYKYNDQIQEILSYINDNIKEDITIDSLSKHFFLSESYICRIFKSSTGTTINKYISARRIAMAKSLLSNGHSVTDVYTGCGFNDYSNFLKAFKKTVGISPKKYSNFSIS